MRLIVRELPEFYNDIDKTLSEIKALLSRGVKDRKSSFHYTTLCTVENNSKPQARTVIFRNFNTEKFYLYVHSDLRSKKINEIKKNSHVSLVFYDDKKKIQLRIRGVAKIVPSKKDSWNKLSNWSRRCYLSEESPGINKQEPSSGFSEKYYFNAPSTEESEKGLQNFSVIEIIAEEIEWLFLASQGHRRILFDIKRDLDNIKIEGRWLVP